MASPDGPWPAPSGAALIPASPAPASSLPITPTEVPPATRPALPHHRPGPATVALTAVVTVAVALAFADSSIVVLALPDLYSEFDTSIVAVSWVVTAYNVAVVVGAFALLALGTRLAARRLAAAGFALFAAASLWCGLAGSFEVLVAARSVQGLGAALLLAASLPVLFALTENEPQARALWAWAGTLGAALGPVIGGVLTELLTWRSIFLVQAPVAAVALLALVSRGIRSRVRDVTGPLRARQWLANAGYVLLFAALVGALFLAVLLAIVVWRLTPIQAALAVSALPVGTLIARPIGRSLPGWASCVAGGVLLGGGLAALALLPDASAAYLSPALAFCGLGLGLLGGVLGPAALPGGAGLLPSANLTIGARHLGFVLGLLCVAPVLAADLTAATLDATRASAQVILDGRVGLTTKVPLVTDLRDEILATPKGRVPDLAAIFDDNGAGNDPALARVASDLQSAIEDTITRAFRPAFAIAAIFGLLAIIPALAVVLSRKPGEGP